MKWFNFKEKKPEKGAFIAEWRYRYPAFCWIGFSDLDEETDESDIPDYWMPLPKPPIVNREIGK